MSGYSRQKIELNVLAVVDIEGNTRSRVMLTPEAQLGDYVLIHAGFSIQVIDEKEAQETLALFAEWADKESSPRGEE